MLFCLVRARLVRGEVSLLNDPDIDALRAVRDRGVLDFADIVLRTTVVANPVANDFYPTQQDCSDPGGAIMRFCHAEVGVGQRMYRCIVQLVSEVHRQLRGWFTTKVGLEGMISTGSCDRQLRASGNAPMIHRPRHGQACWEQSWRPDHSS